MKLIRKYIPNTIPKKRQKDVMKILLIGIVIRLIFMPFSFHSDMIYHHYDSHYFSHHGILDIYNYYADNDLCFVGDTLVCFNYPPPVYFTLGAYQVLVRPLMFGFEPWMEDFAPTISRYTGTALDMINTSRNLYLNLFLMKIPYLIIDVLLAFLLMRFFNNANKSLLAFKLWMLNPFAIYVSAISGVFDTVPALFVMMCLLYFLRRRPNLSATFLGIGVSFKLYPLALILPFIIVASRKFFIRAKLFLLSLLPYLLVSLPFLSQVYIKDIILSPYVKREFPTVIANIFSRIAAIIGVDVFSFLSPFVILYLIFNAFLFFKVRKKNFTTMYSSFLAVLLLFYAASQFDLRHFIWGMPLLVLHFANEKNRKAYWALIILAFAFTFSTQPTLLWGVFAPLSKNLLTFPSFLELFGLSGMPATVVYLILRGGFSATALFIVYGIIKKIAPK